MPVILKVPSLGVGLITAEMSKREIMKINKPTTIKTSGANDSVNAKSHAREKPLLAEYP